MQIHEPHSGHTQRVVTRPLSAVRLLTARFPRDKAKSVSRKHNRHRERATGHALAVRAMASVDHVRRLSDLVAERTTLATAGLRELHRNQASSV